MRRSDHWQSVRRSNRQRSSVHLPRLSRRHSIDTFSGLPSRWHRQPTGGVRLLRIIRHRYGQQRLSRSVELSSLVSWFAIDGRRKYEYNTNVNTIRIVAYLMSSRPRPIREFQSLMRFNYRTTTIRLRRIARACFHSTRFDANKNKKAVLSQGNRAMPQLFFSV